jgi:hypothetical protein
MASRSVFDLQIPRNLTGLLQHLQRMVGVERYRYWCGGTISIEKLSAFLTKMSARYPIERNARQRTYDRSRGRAAVHMVVYTALHGPHTRSCAEVVPNRVHDSVHVAEQGPGRGDVPVVHGPAPTVWWWLVSTEGEGGLADPRTPDAHVARDAMTKDAHITFGDYVLLYATKKEQKVIKSTRTGRTKQVLSDTSSWTWKVRSEVITEVYVGINRACTQLEYGAEPSEDHPGWGLRGLLAAQRQRPLFSGVRTQVLELHRSAEREWAQCRGRWLKAHPQYAVRFKESAGALRSLQSIVHEHLPKMTQHRIFGDAPVSVSDLLQMSGVGMRGS